MLRSSFRYLLLALISLQMTVTTVRSQEPTTLEALTGIPVMIGLEEDFDQRIIFDKPEGRIIHVVLGGDLDPAQALDFYKEVLYQLGWQALESDEGQGLVLTRDQEHLTVLVTRESPLELKLELKPSS